MSDRPSNENPHAHWLRVLANDLLGVSRHGGARIAKEAADEIDRLSAEVRRLHNALVTIEDEKNTYIDYVGDALGQSDDESLWDAAQRVLSSRDRLLEARTPPEATGSLAVCIEGMKHWDWCPICRSGLDTGLECDNCGADLMPICKAFTGGAVPVLNPQGTGETGNDRPAAPISTFSVHMHCTACGGTGVLGGKPCHCRQPVEPPAAQALRPCYGCDCDGSAQRVAHCHSVLNYAKRHP